MSAGRAPAPGELEHLRAFLNTLDVDTGEDMIAEPARLGEWLAERQLTEPGTAVAEGDVARLAALREGLRELLEAREARRLPGATLERLNDVAAHTRLVARFGPGGARLEPAGRGAETAIARLLAIAVTAMAEGSWDRLKICRADSCRWAYYDRSRNRSGSWCSMAVCGNRAKARKFRQRRRRGGGAS